MVQEIILVKTSHLQVVFFKLGGRRFQYHYVMVMIDLQGREEKPGRGVLISGVCG